MLFSLLLYLVVFRTLFAFECLRYYVIARETLMIMCLIISYTYACLIYLIYLMWSFTILGDECMYFILIILSAPPRCMWHGRVTHDSNSLCICSPKQILNMHKFRGSSYLSHTSQSDDIFHAYYHLSKLWSICCHQLPKRGRLKVQLSLGGFGNS